MRLLGRCARPPSFHPHARPSPLRPSASGRCPHGEGAKLPRESFVDFWLLLPPIHFLLHLISLPPFLAPPLLPARPALRPAAGAAVLLPGSRLRLLHTAPPLVGPRPASGSWRRRHLRPSPDLPGAAWLGPMLGASPPGCSPRPTSPWARRAPARLRRQELLDRDPLLVFDEDEYGVTGMFYAATRGRDAEVFRMLLDHAMSPTCSTNCWDGEGANGSDGGRTSVFRLEMMSSAVHAAARGGSVEMLRELVQGRSDVSAYLDVRGSTVLHAATRRGQLEMSHLFIARCLHLL